MKIYRFTLLLLVLFVACGSETDDPINKGGDNNADPDPVKVTGVSLDIDKITLYKDEELSLVATILPEDATDKSMEWKSSAPEIARVDKSGKIIPQKEGEARITVKTVDGEKQASCLVYVTGTYNVLHIGNSFTQDAIENHYADLIAKSGITDKVFLSWLHKGGRTVAEHSEKYKVSDAPEYNEYYYQIMKPSGNTMKWEHVQPSGTGNSPKVVKATQWNLITIQEHTGNKDAWEWNDRHRNNLEGLIQNIRKDQKGAPKIVYVMAVAYGDPAKMVSSSEIKTMVLQNHFQSDQKKMYDVIVDRAKKAIAATSVDGVIATGTMLQNLRTSSANTPVDLTRDGYHMDKGIARYGAACTFFESIFTPVFGVKLDGSYANTSSNTAIGDNYTTPVTTINGPLALKAARSAIEKPFEITPMTD